MTIEILGALGLLLLCVIFAAMGLMEAYKSYNEEPTVNPNFHTLTPPYITEATEPLIEENKND